MNYRVNMRNRLRVLWLEDIHCQEVANNAVVKIGKHGSTNAILRCRLYVCGNYLLASGTKNNVLVKSNKVHIDKTLIFFFGFHVLILKCRHNAGLSKSD